MAEDIHLWPHQVEAVDAITSGLDIPPGKRIPAAGLRGTVVAACGTGKTFIAAAAAHRMVPHGRVLVLLPTLDLLAQTIAEWKAFGHAGPAVAVCSLEDDPRLYSLGVRTTTSAPQLALWHGRGAVTVYATYASLPVLIEAHEGGYGLPMDVWDLVVVDEAHRTSGSLGKAWAAVHDQELLPSMRRLYMTATPRIWQERAPRRWREEVEEERREAGAEGLEGPNPVDRLPEEMACSMDDQSIYGAILWELSLAEAVSRGLLARYQIVVVELRDERLTPDVLYGENRNEEQVRGERLAVLQAALLETMTEHRLRSTITFHHRTLEARAFSEGLPAVARRLHAADPERHPERVWTGWLYGDHDPDTRAEQLRQFGSRAGRAIMSNCRVLGEGIDVPAVDSVALIDPKGSAVDIVQAIGRALRQKPKQGKLATLIVPVFLRPGETTEDMPYSKSFRPLVKVLAGLRAHDERAVEMLAEPQNDHLRTYGTSPYLGEEPSEGEEEARPLLRFGAHRDPALIARFVRYNLIEPEHENWLAGHRAAAAYRRREGHLNVPYEHCEGPHPLGRWLADQRRTYRAGTMLGKRAADLEALDIVWDPANAAWEENLGAARAYHAEHGTLAAPVTATILEHPVGQWLANNRKSPNLDPDRAAQLAAIDRDWKPAWPIDWQRRYTALNTLLAAGTSLEDVVPGVTVRGEDIGRWLATQRRDWKLLDEKQQAWLAALGVTPEPAAPTRPRRAATGAAFDRGLEALARYAAREGRVVVPRAHTEELPDGTPVRLGVWLSNTRTRRGGLTAEQRERLADLGVDWAR
ncbi:Helicase associated domain protein [Streptomyces sp. NPDC046161]|uniref:DEAD/DEAH box helicase n=1 Tax=Streptomyces sp. NPDC046161 TaxID=3155132 RepID=UPI0033F10000